MPFTLPDYRPTAPKQILTGLPSYRPAVTPAQIAARSRAEEAWFRPLTHKQRRFVAALYANGFDVVLAAREADPSIPAHRIRTVGQKWMKQPNIIAAVEALHAYYMENTKVRLEDMVEEIKAIAFSDISNFFSEDGEMPTPGDPKYKSVSEIAITPTRWGRSIRVKQYDKLAAMEKLLKIYSPTHDPVAPQAPGSTTVNVQTVNIVPVPQGMFIPAPSVDDAPQIIDHAPQPRRELPSSDAFVLATE